MEKELFGYDTEAKKTTQIFDELDEYSKKRISLHKVATYENGSDKVKGYSYHMVIIDLSMTLNITVSESAIINMIKSLK